MVDLRKILIIFVISILFSAFVITGIEAVYPAPDYEDYCSNIYGPRPVAFEKPIQETPAPCPDVNPTPQAFQQCNTQKGYIDYKSYDSNGCPKEPFCNTCQNDFNLANEKYSVYYFIIAAIAGLIAIGLGVLLPSTKNPLHEWIGTGFMLGGLFVLFFGTIRTFGDLHRYVRPLIILIELLIIIWLSYKKLGNHKR